MHIYQCFLKIVMLETIYIEKCCIQLRKLLNRSIFTSGFRLKNPTVCSLTQMSELQPQIAQTSVIMVQCVNNECVCLDAVCCSMPACLMHVELQACVCAFYTRTWGGEIPLFNSSSHYFPLLFTILSVNIRNLYIRYHDKRR